ncbi:endonuclease III-like protein 1 [Microplitis mediator]|uniref:endonuclease III-like protein 1 n=1 Tax=Microplitis mediator TaxID=375433 RepID=UPI0025538372|nr:endonuclease III-like protein 1 [Microplitis mediator]
MFACIRKLLFKMSDSNNQRVIRSGKKTKADKKKLTTKSVEEETEIPSQDLESKKTSRKREPVEKETEIPSQDLESKKSSRKRKPVEKKTEVQLQDLESKKSSRKREPVEKETEVQSQDLESKKTSRKRKPVEIKYEESGGEKSSTWSPKNWQETWDLIKEMKVINPQAEEQLDAYINSDPKIAPEVRRYQSLIAVMMSTLTRDQLIYPVVKRLREHGFNPKKIIDTSDEDLGQLIRPVSFVKRKVQFIKQTTGILIEKYNGDIPRNIKELCSLPGVGPKVGHLAMLSAWNEVSGIGVDTHVHRVCNRLHWVKKPTTIPEETRKQLESWLPRDLWSEINFLFVGFGQNVCLGQNPKCDQCLLNKSCPSAIKSPTKNKKVKK